MTLNLFEYLVNLLYPPACAACSKSITSQDSARHLCAECSSDITPISSPLCPLCGIPFTSRAGNDHVCGSCIKRRPVFDSARALFQYEGTIRKLIHRIKFNADSNALRVLSQMAGDLLQCSDFTAYSSVVPIPLHISRLRERGYNQAVVLVRRIFPSEMVKTDLLERVKATRPQMELSSESRKKNVQGAFRLRAGRTDAVKGNAILLFDDIITTGSTAESAAAVLKRAGASRVDVMAIARTITQSRCVSVQREPQLPSIQCPGLKN